MRGSIDLALVLILALIIPFGFVAVVNAFAQVYSEAYELVDKNPSKYPADIFESRGWEPQQVFGEPVFSGLPPRLDYFAYRGSRQQEALAICWLLHYSQDTSIKEKFSCE